MKQYLYSEIVIIQLYMTKQTKRMKRVKEHTRNWITILRRPLPSASAKGMKTSSYLMIPMRLWEEEGKKGLWTNTDFIKEMGERTDLLNFATNKIDSNTSGIISPYLNI